MRKRPPLPLELWHSEENKDDEEVGRFLHNDEWVTIRTQGLASLDEVRRIEDIQDLSQGVSSQDTLHTQSEREQSDTDFYDEVEPTLDKSSSLYSFWHDLGPTLATIISEEWIDRTNAGWNHTSYDSKESIHSDSMSRHLHNEINHKALSSSTLYHSGIDHSPIDHSTGQVQIEDSQRWKELNDQHGLVVGSYGMSRCLTWSQLVNQPVVTPLPLINTPIKPQKTVGARSLRRRKKMRIARVHAYYHQQ